MPTPTASAELVTEFNFQLGEKLKNIMTKMHESALNKVEGLNQYVDLNRSKLKNPMALLREKSQRLDIVDLKLHQHYKNLILNKINKIKDLDTRLNIKSPLTKLILLQDKIQSIYANINRGIQSKLKANRNFLEKLTKNINILSPLSILDRGYAIIMNNKGLALKSSKETAKGEKLKARLSKGSIEIEVKNVQN